MARKVLGALLPAVVLAFGAAAVPAVAAVPVEEPQCGPASLSRLDGLMAELDARAAAGQAGQAQYWYVDPQACRLGVAVLRGADDERTEGFVGAATAVAGQSALTTLTELDTPVVRRIALVTAPDDSIARMPGTLHGGSVIYSGTSGTVYQCTNGFNNYRAGTTTTAGHCADAAKTWYDAKGNKIGSVSAGNWRFPGSDWAVITPVAGWTLPNDVVGDEEEITAFGKATLGEPVCGRGSTTGTQCGTVTALNVTVNYPDGLVRGLVRSSQSGGEGDSGGPVYHGGTGLGLISGGPANGSTTFFQPMNF
ncbi:S1 family peptidase [Kitasatospora sp. NPDC048540]|uniref:S1 family peptidase n=1 Tax=unclassified Kitasatospora TaxID=2633591 RepID=UPI0006898F5F|nr:S1 family peptidase [Kitasatospora sp. MBT63]